MKDMQLFPKEFLFFNSKNNITITEDVNINDKCFIKKSSFPEDFLTTSSNLKNSFIKKFLFFKIISDTNIVSEWNKKKYSKQLLWGYENIKFLNNTKK